MGRSQPNDQPKRYRITIHGQVLTTGTGTQKDQSAQQGALRALHALGLGLVSVETLEEDVDG